MTPSLPPELLSEEEREARAAELEHRITREWIRFAIVENAILLLPLIVLVGLYLSDSISHGVLVAGVVAVAVVTGVFTMYWAFVRIRPLQAELAALGGDEVDTA